ncbi:MAG TPA: hypothetical protein VN176_06555 [Verrucomicrobiae bacterium]|nr:hypothetical protein [Verrucomicrobiae bacterium]
MAISDTSPEIAAMQIGIRRSLSDAQRLQIALDMSLFARELTKAGIRRDHPEWSEKQIMIEVFRLAFLPKPLPVWVR